MPSSVLSVMSATGLEPDGVVRWGELINSDEPGIYVVSIHDDPAMVGHDPCPAQIDEERVKTLLSVRPELTVDGSRPSPESLAQRLAEFWLPDENILYIGLATDLHDRVNQYYGTPLGARRPHAGGWFLKTLKGLDNLFVHWTRTYERVTAEGQALGAFVQAVSEQSLQLLGDPERPFPFANLEWPPGTRKRHGIRRAKAPRARLPGTESGARGIGRRASATSTDFKPPSRDPGSRGSGATQRVTDADIRGGRIRIPRASKHLFPAERARVEVELRGARTVASWDPRLGPPERSGVLGVGKDLVCEVTPDEVLRVAATGGSSYRIE